MRRGSNGNLLAWCRFPARFDDDLNALYFDHNATTPLCEAAREAWLAVAERHWHNPSSLYPDAGAAKRRLEDAREAFADLLGIDRPERVVFTAGATDANNAAIASIARARPTHRALVSPFEHPSVLAAANRHFEDRLGTAATDVATLASDLSQNPTALVAVMSANNETGAIHPAAELAAAARAHDSLFLCDATQSFGKVSMGDLLAMGDVIVGSAHKFGGPKGTGFAVFNDAAAEVTLQTGGPQESGRRAGTEDLAGIAAMVAALDRSDLAAASGQAAYRDRFERGLAERMPGTKVLAANGERLPNTSMVVMPSGKNLKWLTRLGRRGVSISTGSACSSGSENGSHVLRAMGVPEEEISRALRISSGPTTTEKEWRALLDAMVAVRGELGSENAERKPTLDLGSL